MPHHNDPEVIRRLLAAPAGRPADAPVTWAVAGLSTDQNRTAYGVARWMRRTLGIRVIPLHPRAEQVWGEPGYRHLGEVPDGEQVAVVDCFVNSSHVGAVVDDAIAHKDRLGIGAVWLQLGVVDEAAADRATEAGLDVVMNTCPAIQYPKVVAGQTA